MKCENADQQALMNAWTSSTWCFGAADRAFHALQTDSSPPSYQLPSRHPQVRQREQRDELRRVLRQAAVAHLGEAELPLDHAEGVLDLRADAGLHLLHSFSDELGLDERVELLALARAHGHMPRRPFRLGPVVHALVASVAEG